MLRRTILCQSSLDGEEEEFLLLSALGTRSSTYGTFDEGLMETSWLDKKRANNTKNKAPDQLSSR